MRKKLRDLGKNERHTFQGVFQSVGIKSGFPGKMNRRYLPTILFAPVSCDGEQMTDHLWCNYTKQFLQLGMLQVGDVIQFNARVNSYLKGYDPFNQEVDYGIERPTKIHLLNHSEVVRLPLPCLVTDKNALIGYIMKINQQYYESTGRPFDDWYVEQYQTWRTQHQTPVVLV